MTVLNIQVAKIAKKSTISSYRQVQKGLRDFFLLK